MFLSYTKEVAKLFEDMYLIPWMTCNSINDYIDNIRNLNMYTPKTLFKENIL